MEPMNRARPSDVDINSTKKKTFSSDIVCCAAFGIEEPLLAVIFCITKSDAIWQADARAYDLSRPTERFDFRAIFRRRNSNDSTDKSLHCKFISNPQKCSFRSMKAEEDDYATLGLTAMTSIISIPSIRANERTT